MPNRELQRIPDNGVETSILREAIEVSQGLSERPLQVLSVATQERRPVMLPIEAESAYRRRCNISRDAGFRGCTTAAEPPNFRRYRRRYQRILWLRDKVCESPLKAESPFCGAIEGINERFCDLANRGRPEVTGQISTMNLTDTYSSDSGSRQHRFDDRIDRINAQYRARKNSPLGR